MYYNGTASETTIFVGGMLEKHTAGGITVYRHTITAGDQPVALYTRPSSGSITTQYFLLDHLGSVAGITNILGLLDVAENFVAFGQRRDASDWSGSPSAADKAAIAGITQRGYTFHTNSEESSLIHMNGRIADSLTGRFLSADPYVFEPMLTQSFNRYSYVNNNPLSMTDPSGFDAITYSIGYTLWSFGKKLLGKKKRPPPKGCFVAGGGTACYGKAVATRLFDMARDIYGLPPLQSPGIWGAGEDGFGTGTCSWSPNCMSLGDEFGSQMDQTISEREVLETMIEHARKGILGFEIPTAWHYKYYDQIVGCLRLLSGCARAEPSKVARRVVALSTREPPYTEFFRGSASASTIGHVYRLPGPPDTFPSPVTVPIVPYDAYEQAAFTIGHDVNGHINHRLGDSDQDEQLANYYGRLAVEAFRKYRSGAGP